MHPFVLNDAVLGSELDLNNFFVTAKIPWWACSRETHMFCHISYCSQLPCSTFLGHSFLPVVWSFHIQKSNLLGCFQLSQAVSKRDSRKFYSSLSSLILPKFKHVWVWTHIFLMEERLTLTAAKLESHRRDISLGYLQTFSTGRGPLLFFSNTFTLTYYICSSNWIILPGI